MRDSIIHYVTTNVGKLNTMQKDLDAFGYEVKQYKLEIMELQAQKVETIASYKVLQAYEKLATRKDENIKVACQDSALVIPSLGGWPGAYIKDVLDNPKMHLHSILKLLEEEKDRSCYFAQCIAYMDSKLNKPITFVEKIPGTISKEELGFYDPAIHWSKLSLIFIPDGYTKSLAQMSSEEYYARRNQSKEERAGKMFGKWLSENRN